MLIRFAVLLVAAGFVTSVSVRSADTDLSTIQNRVDRLEALTGRVEAISAIKRLQHAYGHYSELGLWHDFADLGPLAPHAVDVGTEDPPAAADLLAGRLRDGSLQA